MAADWGMLGDFSPISLLSQAFWNWTDRQFSGYWLVVVIGPSLLPVMRLAKLFVPLWCGVALLSKAAFPAMAALLQLSIQSVPAAITCNLSCVYCDHWLLFGVQPLLSSHLSKQRWQCVTIFDTCSSSLSLS